MSLGFALVHPARLETAIAADPLRMVLDDGVDTLMASLSVADPVALAKDYGREVMSLFADLSDEFAKLFVGDGPLAGLLSSLTDLGAGGLSLGGVLEKVCSLLESLDRGQLSNRLKAFIDAALRKAPLLANGELFDRLSRIALLAIEHYQRAFVSGRDDLAAHRGFRAGVFLRSLLEPLLAALERVRGTLSLGAVLKARVDEAIGGLDDKLFAGLTGLKALCRTTIRPIAADIEALATLRVGVSVGVRTMAAPARLDEDLFPAPHPPDDGPYWTMDLAGGIAGLFWHFWDYQRTWPPGARFMEHVSTWLVALWEAVRLCTRAAQPKWLQKSYRNNDTYWFSDWGDLWVQLFLRFLATFHDMTDWPNWTMSIGIRLAKYFMLWVQCRLPYLFARSVWYLDKWKKMPEATRPNVPFERYLWAGWAVPWVFSAVLGMLQLWDDFQLQNPFGGVWMGIALVLCLVAGLVGPHAMTSALLGTFGMRVPIERKSTGDQALFAVAAFLIMWLVLMAFGSTNPGQEKIGSEAGAEVVYTLICAVLFVIAIAPAFDTREPAGGEATDFQKYWSHFWQVSVGGALVAGAAPFFMWWIVRDDGRDKHDKYSTKGDLGASPWLLPYASGDAWFCGQGFHGIFSHTGLSALPGKGDNHYAHDFNEAYGKRAIASRPGYVYDLDESHEDGKYKANYVKVVNLDWVEHFDPGTDEERILGRTTYFHLAKEKTRLIPGQVFGRGQFVAQIDDTGVSALNHLHFHGFMLDAKGASHTFPLRFRDASLRRFRSWGHHPGRAFSFRYYESENVEIDPLWHRVKIGTSSDPRGDLKGQAVPGTGHEHTIEIDASILTPSAEIPLDFEVYTDVQDGHRHLVKLTRGSLKVALQRGALPEGQVVTTETSAGHTHTLVFPVQPSAAGASRGLVAVPPVKSTISIAPAPTGQLVSQAELPVDLRGRQLALRVDDEATAYFEWGADRGAIAADVALERGPVGKLEFVPKGSHFSPRSVDVVAAAGEIGVRMMPEHVVRLEPVIVIETKKRGTEARLEIEAVELAKLGLPAVTRVSQGTGFAPDLSAVSPALVLAQVQAAFVATVPPAPALATTLAPTLGVKVAGAAVTSFAGSSGRLEQVLSLAFDAGKLRREGVLPVSDGRLVLTSGAGKATVVLLGTPARLVVSRKSAFLDGATVTEGVLVVTRNGEPRNVTFDVVDTDAEMLARRIMREVSGVRAYPQGDDLVVETLAAGDAVTLQLSKKKPASAPATAVDFTSALAKGSAAPLHGGVAGFGDSSAMTQAELQAAIDDQARFAPGAIAGTVMKASLSGKHLLVESSVREFTYKAGGTVAELLHLAAPAVPPVAAKKLESTTDLADTLDFGVGGWLDLEFASVVTPAPAPAEKRRIAFDGTPARLEFGPVRSWPADGEKLRLKVGTGASAKTVEITEAIGQRSVESLADALRLASSDLIVRIAYRYSFDNAAWGNVGLALAEADGLMSAGLLRALPAAEHPVGRGSDVQALTFAFEHAQTELWPGPIVADAFSAVVDAGQVKVSALSNRTITIEARNGDPFGLAGPPAATPPTLVEFLKTTTVDVPLGKGCRSYRIEAKAKAPATAPETIRSAFELTAVPASVTAETSPELFALAHDLSLKVSVSRPKFPTGVDIFTYTVDFRGVETHDDVVARLSRGLPLATVWLKNHANLHLETLGAGRGWSLKLEGPALPHLGFAVGPTDTALEVSGRGNVRDAQKVTAAEIAAAINVAATYATRMVHQAFEVTTSGTKVVVSSLEGPVSLDVRPAGLRDQLRAKDVGGTVEFDPGAAGTFSLADDGVLELRVAGRLVATTFVQGSSAVLLGTTDPAGQLPAVASSVKVVVNGTPTLVPMTGRTTLDQVILALQTAVPDAWFGVVNDASGHPVLRVETRRRGSSASVSIIVPVAGDLGFSTTTTGPVSGTGVVPNLDQVTPGELAGLWSNAVVVSAGSSSGVSAQPSNVGAGDGLSIAVAGLVDGATLALPVAPVPGGLAFATSASGGRLEAAFVAAVQVVPGTLSFDVNLGGTTLRTVRAPFWGNPARVVDLQLPVKLTDLNGKVLSLTVGTAPRNVSFAAIATADDVVAAIHLVTKYAVKARVRGRMLDLETVRVGAEARIELRAARFGVDALSVIDNPPLPHVAQGSGIANNLEAVSAVEYANAIVGGYAGPKTIRLETDLVTHDRVYRSSAARPTVTRLRLRSSELGCRGSVVPIDPDPVAVPVLLRAASALDFDRSLARGPAARASVRLAPKAAKVALDGVLPIILATPPGSPGPGTKRLEVGFPARADYTAREIAETIDRVLAGEGLGRAAAYPDGVIVLESSVPGLLGTLEVDTAAASASVKAQLVVSGAAKARGWPGAGLDPEAKEPFVHGYRSRPDLAGKKDGIEWVFSDKTYSTDKFKLAATHTTMEVLQLAVDRLLGEAKRSPVTPTSPVVRIGHARIGDDGALYVEGMAGRVLTLEVFENGTATKVIDPADVWLFPDLAPDPGMDLRPTHVIRTWRRVFDPVGQTVPAHFHDLGWMRVTVNATTAVPTTEADVRPGHHYLSARPEAGRAGTATYGTTTDPVVSGGQAKVDGRDLSFVHQVRFGVRVTTAAGSDVPILGVDRIRSGATGPGNEFLFHVFVS